MISGTDRVFGSGGETLLPPEDTQVDLLELSRWVDAEATRQQLASLVVDLERLGLAAGRVQRAHEQGTGTFGQRVARHQDAELADEAGSLAELVTMAASLGLTSVRNKARPYVATVRPASRPKSGYDWFHRNQLVVDGGYPLVAGMGAFATSG